MFIEIYVSHTDPKNPEDVYSEIINTDSIESVHLENDCFSIYFKKGEPRIIRYARNSSKFMSFKKVYQEMCAALCEKTAHHYY